MNGRMSREEFETNLFGRDIHKQVENILVEIVHYNGPAIHKLSPLESRLGHVRSWLGTGWLKGAKTFSDLKKQDPEQYEEIISDLYTGFERGLYKI